ncbi:metal-dependent hydrolase [Bacillus mangrovi]|uniref:Metal-dependent hydrolase n=1 Tax=Metabacillus mangrovi TaxID=1491830 RepID=A0A7X2S2N3_9BACI|nr:metal-dependent hydrolase [Metabacillus mangrovi]MTH52091.1 metal-dependent hydrolase [Metabacillus mangrovi]
MDTSTHIAMGFGLAGLASLDPAVSGNPALAQAIMAGTVLGSNAPDFDYAIKLAKGEGTYLRHHRNLSHSVPFWFIWAVLLTAGIYPFFQGISAAHLFGWTLAAVLIHVFTDLFNSYGTKAGRPFTGKWITLDAIYIFDPFIMLLHAAGFILWASGLPSGIIFAAVYSVMLLYMAARAAASARVRAKAASSISPGYRKVKAIPTIRWGIWNVCAESDQYFITGEYRHGRIEWVHSFSKQAMDDPAITASRFDENVQHFLVNAEMAYACSFRRQNKYEVRWFDVRYRTKNHYPFMAVVQLDEKMKISSSETGWIHRVNTFDQPPQMNESAASQ